MSGFWVFVDQAIQRLANVRLDGMLLYLLGMIYYSYLHYKHNDEIVDGLKGKNKMWEAPEIVIYIWVQSFPFVIFADAFLGLVMSSGMMWIFTLILFFAIMGRAGVDLLINQRTKIIGNFEKKLESKDDNVPKIE